MGAYVLTTRVRPLFDIANLVNGHRRNWGGGVGRRGGRPPLPPFDKLLISTNACLEK